MGGMYVQDFNGRMVPVRGLIEELPEGGAALTIVEPDHQSEIL